MGPGARPKFKQILGSQKTWSELVKIWPPPCLDSAHHWCRRSSEIRIKKTQGLSQKHQIYAHVLWVTFGDLSSIGIVWSPLVLLVTHVCARFESYFQNAILGSTDPFVFKVIRICGSVWVHTCSCISELPWLTPLTHLYFNVIEFFFLNLCQCLSSLMLALIHRTSRSLTQPPKHIGAHYGGSYAINFHHSHIPFSQFSLNESFWKKNPVRLHKFNLCFWNTLFIWDEMMISCFMTETSSKGFFQS